MGGGKVIGIAKKAYHWYRISGATTSEMVDNIGGMLIDDRQVKVSEIAEPVAISCERVENILDEYLEITILFPHDCRLTISREYLAMFNRNKKDSSGCFVTADDTCIQHNISETKKHSK